MAAVLMPRGAPSTALSLIDNRAWQAVVQECKGELWRACLDAETEADKLSAVYDIRALERICAKLVSMANRTDRSSVEVV